jgi:TRAP-type C4-dicarboxylate transport system substrate-binding protein
LEEVRKVIDQEMKKMDQEKKKLAETLRRNEEERLKGNYIPPDSTYQKY